MLTTEYMYEVNYSVYYPDTDEFKPNRNYQVVATSEMNACTKIGQLYNDAEVGKLVDIQAIKKVSGYERLTSKFGE